MVNRFIHPVVGLGGVGAWGGGSGGECLHAWESSGRRGGGRLWVCGWALEHGVFIVFTKL